MIEKPQLHIHAEQAGRFQLITEGPTRGRIDHGWTDNLILDQGIARLLSTNGSVLQYISVGSDGTPPAVTDTQLGAGIARVSSLDFQHGYDAVGGYGWARVSKQFGQGAAAGNVAELGIGWNNGYNGLWSRALVPGGTVTVLSDEFLTVVYELRSWWNTPSPHIISYTDKDGNTASTTVAYTDPAKTNAATGAAALYARGTPLYGNYFTSSWVGTDGNFKVVFNIDQGNPKIARIKAGTGGGGNGYTLPFYDSQFCTFSPAIEKTNEFEVTITGKLTITRK